jgi:hypothetical protein
MNRFVFLILFILSARAFAEAPCDLRPGTSVGVKVIEFFSGEEIHSKMPFVESSPNALLEEMISLQDMGICEETIISKKCILKLEKMNKQAVISMIRGGSHWNSWKVESKERAQHFVKHLKKAGFCS